MLYSTSKHQHTRGNRCVKNDVSVVLCDALTRDLARSVCATPGAALTRAIDHVCDALTRALARHMCIAPGAALTRAIYHGAAELDPLLPARHREGCLSTLACETGP
jgi:hypothetical protein